MNFIFWTGLLAVISGLGLSGLFIYYISKKIIPVSIPAFLGLFMAGICAVSGFVTMAQGLEDYRNSSDSIKRSD